MNCVHGKSLLDECLDCEYWASGGSAEAAYIEYIADPEGEDADYNAWWAARERYVEHRESHAGA